MGIPLRGHTGSLYHKYKYYWPLQRPYPTCSPSVIPCLLQMLLRVGIMKAQKQPTEMHPYGYARDQFIWPLISAVGIFCCGAGVSFVHGVTGLFEAHRELGDLYWNFVGR